MVDEQIILAVERPAHAYRMVGYPDFEATARATENDIDVIGTPVLGHRPLHLHRDIR
jgi:hypothetical protein